MKLPRRMRRWLARTGILACFTVTAVWIASEFGQLSTRSAYWNVEFQGGALWIWHSDVARPWPVVSQAWTWRFNRYARPSRRWLLPRLGRFQMYRPIAGGPATASAPIPPGPGTVVAAGQALILPLWIPFLLVAVPTSIWFRRDRRRIPPHCCQRCGYDLTGNTSGVCPECGAKA